MFEDGLAAGSVRRLCDSVLQTCGGRCAVFSSADDQGLQICGGLPGG